MRDRTVRYVIGRWPRAERKAAFREIAAIDPMILQSNGASENVEQH
jgi:hypothetical protein